MELTLNYCDNCEVYTEQIPLALIAGTMMFKCCTCGCQNQED